MQLILNENQWKNGHFRYTDFMARSPLDVPAHFPCPGLMVLFTLMRVIDNFNS
jgi:hypothetical protein